jgi:hypothetical protein
MRSSNQKPVIIICSHANSLIPENILRFYKYLQYSTNRPILVKLNQSNLFIIILSEFLLIFVF